MPVLRISETAVRHNIESVLGMMSNDSNRWRPHLKTTKCSTIWKLLPDYGITNVKCATVREARVFLNAMRELNLASVDLLVAYPLRDMELRALGAIAAEVPRSWRVSVLVEDPACIDAAPESLGLYLDLNPGMNRSGVPFDERGRIETLYNAAGNRLRGVHAYEGHLAGLEPDIRTARADAVYASLDALLHGLNLPRGLEIVTSGTPAFPEALRSRVVFSWMQHGWTHRVSPGTVVFHDARTIEDVPSLRTLQAAALVEATVVSRPSKHLVTVNAGSKSIAAEAGDPCVTVVDHPNLLAMTPSEEHLPLRVLSGAQPAYGAVVHLMPRHVCPTVNLAERAIYVRTDGSEDVIEIDARAHDLFQSEL